MAVSKRYIVNLTNGAFDIAGDVIDSLQDKVTDFFNEITQEVKGFIFPPELSGHGIFDLAFGGGDKRLRKAGSSLTAEEETMDSSVKATYLDYQIHHGGVGAALNRVSPILVGDSGMEDLFQTVIKPLLDDFIKLIEQAVVDVALLLNDKDDISFGDALSRLTFHLVEGLLQLVEDLINAILELAKTMIDALQMVLNDSVDNGLISLFTGGGGFSLLDLAAWMMAPLVHFAYVVHNGEGMPKDNPLPDFAAQVPGRRATAAEAPKAARADDGYVNPSHVSESAKRFDLTAGILEGVAGLFGLAETIVDGFSLGSRQAAGARSSLAGANSPPLTHPAAQMYKFLGPDPLTHRLHLDDDPDKAAVLGARAAGRGDLADPKGRLGWATVFFQAVGVIVTMPYWHGFQEDDRKSRRLKLTVWFFSLFDVIGIIGLQKVKNPSLGKGEEPVWSMFWSFLSFLVSLGVTGKELKDVKAEDDKWDNDTVDAKLSMARLRLSLVFIDGIHAVSGGFYVLVPEAFTKTVLAAVTGLTSVAGIAMVETTVGVCWNIQSKNYFVCV